MFTASLKKLVQSSQRMTVNGRQVMVYDTELPNDQIRITTSDGIDMYFQEADVPVNEHGNSQITGFDSMQYNVSFRVLKPISANDVK